MPAVLTVAVVGGTEAQAQAAVTDFVRDHPRSSDQVRILLIDDDRTGAAARDWPFRDNDSDWVLCLEPQVRLEPGALAGLLSFIAENPRCPDLLQGPRCVDGNGPATTHLDPVWHDGVFGLAATALDYRGATAEIEMQDLGLFACRAQSWPGLNPRLRGSARHEGYLHKKFRARGRRTLSLSSLRWRRIEATVEPQGESALRDYLIAWSEVGLASEPMLAHFAEFLGPRAVGEVVAAYDAERANPFTFFDAILCVSLESTPEHWQTMRRRFSRLAIADRVHRISATAADNHHVARALSHRKAVRYAKVRGLTNVLVFQDDVVFLPGTSRVLRRSLRELDRRPWDVLYLGGHPRDLGDTRTFVPLPGCSYLEQVEGMICTHALAYHQRVYDTILAQLPANEDDMADWITANGSIDRYLTERVKGAYRTVPVLALEGTTD